MKSTPGRIAICIECVFLRLVADSELFYLGEWQIVRMLSVVESPNVFWLLLQMSLTSWEIFCLKTSTSDAGETFFFNMDKRHFE